MLATLCTVLHYVFFLCEMNIQLGSQTSCDAAYIQTYIVYIDYIYCSLDDNVGIYKMIFIFIKLENDNSNETNARAGALHCP